MQLLFLCNMMQLQIYVQILAAATICVHSVLPLTKDHSAYVCDVSLQKRRPLSVYITAPHTINMLM